MDKVTQGAVYAAPVNLRPAHVAADRIGFLDGFRGIAILIVLSYHYYSRFASDPRGIYPFGNSWADFPPFEYGFYGVHLFFAVSGFVISLTLMRCESLSEFTVRRFARLWPTMLLCACLSYGFLTLFPNYWPQQISNFLPSLTFIDGMHYERFFPGTDFDWIDGAYWSLFVEVRFYAIAAALYFINRARFLIHVLLFSLVVCGGYWALQVAQQARVANIVHDLLIPTYLPWFLLGIAAHCLWAQKQQWAAMLAATAFLPLVLYTSTSGSLRDVAVAMLVCGLFLLCYRFALIRKVFSGAWLTAIGVSSYSLYLLHQNIGVTATSLLAQHWLMTPRVSFVVPLLVSVVLIFVARLIYRFWETPLNRSIVSHYRRPEIAGVVTREQAR